MRNFKRTKIILLTLFFAFTIVNAQETNEKKSTRVGIGVSLLDLNDVMGFVISQGTSQSSTLCLTIDSSPTFRIEPEIGYFVYNRERKDNNYKSENTLKSYRIGAGLFVKKSKDTNFHMFYGVRLGYLSSSAKSKYSSEFSSGKDEESSSGFYIAPALGGEYNFSDYFSLGGETQFMYSSTSFEDSDNPDAEVTMSTFSLKALIFVRYYF